MRNSMLLHSLKRWIRRAGLILALLLAMQAAHAAIDITSYTVNGGASTTAQVGANVTVVVNVTTSGGGVADDWSALEWAWAPVGTTPAAYTCDTSPNILLAGNHSLTFSLPAPATAGTYDLFLIAYNQNSCNGGRSNVTASNALQATPVACNPPSNIPAGVAVTCICDDFNRTTLNPSTIFGQNWITSTSDTTGILPSVVGNTLRLTNFSLNNAKAATVPAAFPAAGNYFSIDFLHYAYTLFGGSDGIAITFSDYNVPAVPGGFGGSLGYAQRTGVDGFAGGWIGVAIDEFGNFQNPTEGRVGGPGRRQDSVSVRGSGSGQTGYRWLAGTAANLSPGIDVASLTRGPGHRYQIVVDARNAAAATPQTLVAVNRDTTGVGNSYTALVSSFDVFAQALALYPGNPQAPVPANWQISFTGSTGGSIPNIHEIDSLRICAQTIVPPTGGTARDFAAIDEAYGTPAIPVQNYLTGRIYTKLAGTPFRLNIAALNGSNQIQTGYVVGAATRNVNVKLVDNSDGVCVLNSAQANFCSAACQAKTAVPGGSQTLTFTSANAGQRQSADFTIPGAWSNLVALISDGTAINANGNWDCSTDAFSVRPLNFNSLSSTASNSALTGTPALRAGTDTFSMTVGTATSGYAGAAALPTINTAAMAATAAGWTVGSIAPGTFPAATASSSTGSTFTYSEVGNFRFLGYDPATDTTSPRGLFDSTWTAVDQGTQFDCIAGSYANTRDTSGTFASNPNFGKFGCLFGITSNSALFGRFTPSHFALTTGSVTPACTGTTRNFTYMGQSRLGVAYRLEAQNGANGVTQNYDATRYTAAGGSLPVPQLVAEDQAVANQGCDLGTRLAAAPTASWAAGVYNASTATASITRPTNNPPTSLNASSGAACSASRAQAASPLWSLDIGVQVTDGSAAMLNADMNASATGTCSGAGCNARRLGSTGIVLGRLNLVNAYGSDALPLLVPVRAEYWNGTIWQLNTDDRCTTPAAGNLAVGNVTPASGSSLNVTSASLALSPAATLSGGISNFRINPATRGAGSVDLVLNLGTGVDSNVDWCGGWTSGPAAGTGTAPSPDLSFLLGNWCGSNADRAPAARIRFGSPRAPFIYLRERY
jgi:MSHA biogenesis protein MshQ